LTRACLIFSGSVDPALLIAFAKAINPVKALAGTSDKSLPPECVLKRSFTVPIMGIVLAKSVLKGDLVITPSALLPIVSINLGSV
jgi:hypothetical protein